MLKNQKFIILKNLLFYIVLPNFILRENQLSLMKNLSDAQVRRLRQRASDQSEKNTSRLVVLLRLFNKYKKTSEGKKQRNVGEEEE